MKIKIQGGVPLQGSIRVNGAKNSALPAIAASVLSSQAVILSNVPWILDIKKLFGFTQRSWSTNKL